MSDLITDIEIRTNPHLPEEVKRAFNNKELVVFVGAGISRLEGCLGWDSLANNLIEEVCPPSQAHQIINSDLDSKAKITIAKGIAKDKGKLEKFWKTFEKAIEPQEQKKDGHIDIYHDIARFNSPFITTNCDGLLTKYYEHNWTTKCEVPNFKPSIPYVYCIHGNYGSGTEEEKDSLIFTTDSYLQSYSNNAELPKFLRHVMSSNVVLFLGYGLREFEILSPAFDANSGMRPKHILIEGFYSFQQEYCNALIEYFKTIGIKLIPFSKDKNGYKQERIIIEEWIKELVKNTNYMPRAVTNIIEKLNDCSPSNKSLLKQYCEDQTQRKIYLKAISEELHKHNCCFDWISFFISSKIVTVTDMPIAICDKYGVTHPSWDMLGCIAECLANHSIQKDNKKKLTSFILQCIDYIKWIGISQVSISALNAIVQICFELDIQPNNEIWFLWQYWCLYSRDGGLTLLRNYHQEFLEWPQTFRTKYLSTVFSAGDNTNNKLFWFEDFVEFSKELEQNNILEIIENCLNNISNTSESKVQFPCIYDIVKSFGYRYFSALIRVIDELMHMLNDDYLTKIFDYLVQNAHSSFDYQLLFYFARKTQFAKISISNNNPLNKEYVYHDFYCWLNEIIENNLLSDSSTISEIVSWVLNATFGKREESNSSNNIYENDKRIRTYKYQLLKLISPFDQNAYEELKVIEQMDLYGFYTPIEYENINESEIISTSDVEGLEVLPDWNFEEIINSIKGKASTSHDYITIAYKILSYDVLSKTSDKQFEDVIKNISRVEDTLIIAIASALSDEKIIRRFTKDLMKEYIDILSNLISNSTDIKEGLMIQFLLTLERLESCGWNSRDIFELMASIDYNKLFPIAIPPNEDMDLIMNLLNNRESKVYSLLIQSTVFNRKNDAIRNKLKKLINKSLNEASFWMKRACAFEIQNLYYLDSKWVEDFIIPLLEADGDPALRICAILKTNQIIPSIEKFVFENEGIDDVLAYYKDNNIESYSLHNYATHCVNSFYNKIIDKKQYSKVVSNIEKEGIDHIVRAITSKNTKENSKENRYLLRKTFSIYSKSHNDSDMATSIIKNIADIQQLTSDDWELLRKVSEYVNGQEDLWPYLSDCLEITKRKCGAILDTFEALSSKLVLPDPYHFNKIMCFAARLKNTDLIIWLSKYAVEQQINPSKFAKYADDPSAAFDDFKEQKEDNYFFKED